jgi:hypothetical protein
MSRSIMIEAFFMVWRLLAQNKFRRHPTAPPVKPPLDPGDFTRVPNRPTSLQTNQ